MKSSPLLPESLRSLSLALATAVLAWAANLPTFGAPPPLVLDDYSDAKRNKAGLDRLVIDDKSVGGKSEATARCEKGILTVQGQLVPGRGMPGFISLVSLLAAEGKPQDTTGRTGVRLKVKVNKGILCVQVASSAITNFDYHTSAPLTVRRGEFHEVRIPFKDLKRAWSEPIALDLKTLTSVNLVSFSTAQEAFAYEVDEIGLY